MIFLLRKKIVNEYLCSRNIIYYWLTVIVFYNQMKIGGFQTEDQLLKSISLTQKLQHSLKKLLTHKKKGNNQILQQRNDNIHDDGCKKLLQQIQNLKSQKLQLLRQNEILSREIITYKQHLRDINKDFVEMKKYVNFLEEYNASLKKQMVYWLKKPNKQQSLNNHLFVQKKSIELEVQQLRKMNDKRQRELQELDKTFQITMNKNHHLNIGMQKSNSQNRKEIKLFSKKKGNTKQNTNSTYHTTENCKKSTKVKEKNHRSMKINGKFCPCHKSYMQVSDFLY